MRRSFAALCLLTACSFDPSGRGSGVPQDGGPDSGAAPDAVAGTLTLSFRHGQDGYAGGVDTYVHETLPDSAFPDELDIWWDGEYNGGLVIGLARFDDIVGDTDAQIPQGATVVSATLSVVVNNSGNVGVVRAASVPWDSTVTWNSFGGDPGVSDDEMGTMSIPAPGPTGENVLDVQAFVQQWVAEPGKNMGLVFYPPVEIDGVHVVSNEGPLAERPLLTVVFAGP